MAKKVVRLLLCILLLLLPIFAFSQRKITMVTEEWPPFRINDPTEPSGFVGIDIDVVTYLERELGVTIEIQRHPWARALEMMKSGLIDCISGYAMTSERQIFSEYVPTPYYSVRPVFYALKGAGASIKTYDDLYGKVIGQSKNSAYFEPYNSDTRMLKKDLVTEVQIIQMAALGRIDLAIGTDPNISWDIAKLGLRDKLEQTSFIPTVKTDLYIAFSRKSPALDLVPLIDQAIAKMLVNGTFAKIIQKYR